MRVKESLPQNSGTKSESAYIKLYFCGERGIRTPGGVTLNGFQDRRIRPLCHLSAAKVRSVRYSSKISFATGDNFFKIFLKSANKYRNSEIKLSPQDSFYIQSL